MRDMLRRKNYLPKYSTQSGGSCVEHYQDNRGKKINSQSSFWRVWSFSDSHFDPECCRSFKIELHIIDPIFGQIIASDEEGAKPQTCLSRLKEFLCWFDQQSETKVDINIYHHASRYVLATQAHIKPDIFLSIDWIDELGCVVPGLTIDLTHITT